MKTGPPACSTWRTAILSPASTRRRPSLPRCMAASARAAPPRAGVVRAPRVHPATSRWYDPQLVESGFWLSQTRRYIDAHLTPAPPYRFDGVRPPTRGAAPVLGEHTDEVLAELGVA